MDVVVEAGMVVIGAVTGTVAGLVVGDAVVGIAVVGGTVTSGATEPVSMLAASACPLSTP